MQAIYKSNVCVYDFVISNRAIYILICLSFTYTQNYDLGIGDINVWLFVMWKYTHKQTIVEI
jgi:hypothetical protein